MGDVLSMSACITRRTICGFAALTFPIPHSSPAFLYQFLRATCARASICVCTCACVYISVCVCGWADGIGRRRRVNLIVGFWVSASRRHQARYDGVRGRHTGVEWGEDDGRRGCPIRRRASQRQLPATPTRYATVIPRLPPLRQEKLESESGSMWHMTHCCYWLHYILHN